MANAENSKGCEIRAAVVREKVRKILKSHRGHFINFYGEWVIEALER